MADWLELELGRRPRGLWLAERVWEPGLASTLHAAGAEYTAVDDAHFVAAGFDSDDLWGYFLTEDQGRAIGEAAHDLLRGGQWRNCQARYPEANRLHKRTLRVSHRLWQKPAEDDPAWREARIRLWRAQCNCAYWHGVFGGLYLPHLRSALYRELIAAEASVAGREPRLERGHLDLDGVPHAVRETARWAAWISARGGRLWGFDDRERLWSY